MRRKLVKQAGQALTLTLPIEWLRENDLKAGDEVDVAASENNLVITTSKRPATTTTELNCRNWSQGKTRVYLKAFYSLGIDEIELEADEEIDLYEFLGYAITEHRQNFSKVRQISGDDPRNLDEIFKHVMQMLIAFYSKVVDNMLAEKNVTIEGIRNSELEINKYTLFLQRAIMKHAYDDNYIGRIMFAYAFSLEKIGDEIFRLWRTGTNSKYRKAIVKPIILLSKSSVEKSFETMYQYSDNKIEEIRKIKIEAWNKTSKAKNLDATTAEVMGRANRIIEECADLNQLIVMIKTRQATKVK